MHCRPKTMGHQVCIQVVQIWTSFQPTRFTLTMKKCNFVFIDILRITLTKVKLKVEEKKAIFMLYRNQK